MRWLIVFVGCEVAKLFPKQKFLIQEINPLLHLFVRIWSLDLSVLLANGDNSNCWVLSTQHLLYSPLLDYCDWVLNEVITKPLVTVSKFWKLSENQGVVSIMRSAKCLHKEKQKQNVFLPPTELLFIGLSGWLKQSQSFLLNYDISHFNWNRPEIPSMARS